MTTELTGPQSGDPASMTDFYRQRLLSRVESEADLNNALQAINVLTERASREWLTGRVTALLTAYFGASLPAGVLAVELADWLAELEAFPEWAVRDAIRWWRGAENEHRNRKPQPGDIAARAYRELEIIRLSRDRIDTYRRGPILQQLKYTPETDRTEPTEESRERMQAFVAERFPQIVKKG